ncbi:MAG: DUF4932 domain-containing protein [Planctomycetota bacterium]|jgi:hypothetical protein
MKRHESRPDYALAILALSILTLVSGCNAHTEQRPATPPTEAVIRNVKAGGVDIDVSVDPRVELMSIIFRLAGNPEYNQCKIPGYDADISSHFTAHQDHAAVKYAAELKKRRSMGYNAPMGLAVYVGDVPALKELVSLNPRPGELDGRWQTTGARKFLTRARRFASDTQFGHFFDEHKPLYDKAVQDLATVVERHAHLEWFDDFFGQSTNERFHVVLGMANGGSSYGARAVIDDENHIYSMLGVWRLDSSGIPTFSKGLVGTIHHELCHSYANPIVHKFTDELEEAGKRMYRPLEDKMSKQAYGTWDTMMCEYVVRVCTIQYYRRYGTPEEVERVLKYHIDRGFVGMYELDEVVSEFENERQKYATFESFFPRVVEFFAEYSKTLPSDA